MFCASLQVVFSGGPIHWRYGSNEEENRSAFFYTTGRKWPSLIVELQMHISIRFWCSCMFVQGAWCWHRSCRSQSDTPIERHTSPTALSLASPRRGWKNITAEPDCKSARQDLGKASSFDAFPPHPPPVSSPTTHPIVVLSSSTADVLICWFLSRALRKLGGRIESVTRFSWIAWGHNQPGVSSWSNNPWGELIYLFHYFHCSFKKSLTYMKSQFITHVVKY